jgi:hypothetical protein
MDPPAADLAVYGQHAKRKGETMAAAARAAQAAEPLP